VISPKIAKFNESSPVFQIPLLLFYVPCFWAGIVAYKSHSEKNDRLPFFYFPLTLGLLSLLFLFSYDKVKYIFTAFACATVLPLIKEPTSIVLKKVCQLIARYSYGIYLFHYFSIWIAFDFLKNANPIFQWFCFFATVTFLSVFSYHWLEQPFIRVGNRLAQRLVSNRKNSIEKIKAA
jgi:peptidoglycan/LPS O-acetylase OafA/YrhL